MQKRKKFDNNIRKIHFVFFFNLFIQMIQTTVGLVKKN
jgi:hypothetical protein